MPKAKLSKRVVDLATPSERPYVLYDETLTGFGVRIMPTGSKTYIVEYRPGAGGRSVAKRRMALGKTNVLPFEMAKERAAEILAKAQLGGDPADGRSAERAMPSFADFADRFLREHAEAKLKPRTAAYYKWVLETFLKPAVGARKLDHVTRAELLKVHQRVGAEHPTSANRAMQVIGSVYAFAAECELVPEGTNPAHGIKAFREQRKERFLTGEELARLGAALREAEIEGIPWEPNPQGKTKHAPKAENRRVIFGKHAIAAIRLLIFTGARLREILGAKWSWYDADRGCIFLPDSKTGKKTIILNAAALEVIEGLDRVGDFIIASDDPTKPRSDLNRPWAAVRRRAGLEDVRIHDLRHSFASVGVGASWGLPIVGKLLGHASVQSTSRYAHLEMDPLRRASDRIGKQLASALAGSPSKGEVIELARKKR